MALVLLPIVALAGVVGIVLIRLFRGRRVRLEEDVEGVEDRAEIAAKLPEKRIRKTVASLKRTIKDSLTIIGKGLGSEFISRIQECVSEVYEKIVENGLKEIRAELTERVIRRRVGSLRERTEGGPIDEELRKELTSEIDDWVTEVYRKIVIDGLKEIRAELTERVIRRRVGSLRERIEGGPIDEELRKELTSEVDEWVTAVYRKIVRDGLEEIEAELPEKDIRKRVASLKKRIEGNSIMELIDKKLRQEERIGLGKELTFEINDWVSEVYRKIVEDGLKEIRAELQEKVIRKRVTWLRKRIEGGPIDKGVRKELTSKIDGRVSEAYREIVGERLDEVDAKLPERDIRKRVDSLKKMIKGSPIINKELRKELIPRVDGWVKSIHEQRIDAAKTVAKEIDARIVSLPTLATQGERSNCVVEVTELLRDNKDFLSEEVYDMYLGKINVAAHSVDSGMFEREVPAGGLIVRGHIPEDGQIGGHKIEKEIGRGGMGVVYKVKRKPLVVKLILTKENVDSILTEAEIGTKLDHGYIAKVRKLGVNTSSDPRFNGLPFIVVDYAEGKNLEALIEEKTLNLRKKVRITRQVAQALEYARRQGIVHRDIKPSNIIVTANSVKVLDFGIAAELFRREEVLRLTETLTITGTSPRTPDYSPPEQVEGKILDHRSDLFSLGVVLYELITGKRPFAADSVLALDLLIMTGEPKWPSRIDSDLVGFDPIVRRLLQKEPANRYQSAQELIRDLKELEGRLPKEDSKPPTKHS